MGKNEMKLAQWDESMVWEHLNRVNLSEIQNKVQQEVEKILIHSGIYYRIFGRVKTVRSLCNKLKSGKYTSRTGRKVQDLIGVRVVLYFSEDIKVCRELFDNFYGKGEYSESKYSTENFGPAKRNGIYQLPDEVKMAYHDSVNDLPVDEAFEIQLRTVSFEGWHEIEHDMRYKMHRSGNLVEDKELSRMLNSVLASYELNDWALIRIFNELSLTCLASKNWEEMLRTRFRVKISEKSMNPKLVDILNHTNSKDIQAIYDCDRHRLIIGMKEFVEQNRYAITYNSLIYLLNKMTCRNPLVDAFFMDHPLETKPLEISALRPLSDRIVFDGTWDLEWGEKEIDRVGDVLYAWCREQAGSVFRGMPVSKEEINDRLHMSVPGYKLKFKYNDNSINMFLKHPDMERPATIWMISAEYNDNVLRVMTRYYSPDTSVDLTHFSEPVFLNSIREKGLFRKVSG